MTEKLLLKDILFNQAKVEKISVEICSVYPSFQKNEFLHDVVTKFSQLELKARISWIAECLKKYLPNDYRQAVAVILKSLPAPNNPKLFDDDFGDFIYASYADYIAKNGCKKQDLSVSLDALYEITQRFSAEYAIRYFINAFPKETLTKLEKWSRDNNYHVRRLCSEGTRPKLPWAQKINISATSSILILDNLFFDKTRFVTRSVANHINDISKIDPNLAIETLLRWKKSEKQTVKEMDYIIRHALRSLVKIGNVEAMKFLGISPNAPVKIFDLKITEKIKMNSALEFSFNIKASEAAQIIADYIIYFQSKSGTIKNKKVFKLKKFSLIKGENLTLTKRHILKENMTTRKIFPGEHEIEIQINGKSYGRKSFWIIPN